MNKRTPFLPSPPKPVVVVLGLSLALFLGLPNDGTGRDLSSSAFHPRPVCGAGQPAGRPAEIPLVVSSTAGWFVADQSSGPGRPRAQLVAIETGESIEHERTAALGGRFTKFLPIGEAF